METIVGGGGGESESAVELLLRAAALVPAGHYALAVLAVASVVAYRLLELHVVGDLLRGFRGGRVELTFHPASHIYHGVASKCRSLHGRQLYTTNDGATVALDWLLAANLEDLDGILSKDASTPLVVIVPGLTSHSYAAYVKHLAYSMARKGCNIVVCNHRGLGGVPITSNRVYHAGFTKDVREVINYLHQNYPKAPMLCVGTSLGANILVKYLGEEGENTPVAGAVSICSPWDLLLGDRFISRKLVQRFYDKALAFGLKGYAKLHQPLLARLSDWECIKKSIIHGTKSLHR